MKIYVVSTWELNHRIMAAFTSQPAAEAYISLTLHSQGSWTELELDKEIENLNSYVDTLKRKLTVEALNGN